MSEEADTPKDELLKALNKLQEFTKKNSKEPSPFEQTIDLLRSIFFSEYRQAKARKILQVNKDLVKSVGLIKNYLPLIKKYKEGSEEEKKFADTIYRTIEKYNELLSDPVQNGQNLKIDFSTSSTYQVFSNSAEEKIIYTIFKGNKKQTDKLPTKEEIDTLKMKAIRLIENQEGSKAIFLENFNSANGSQFEGEDGKTITLVQTWSDLPGEVHKIVGAFKRESRHSIPIKDSFKLHLESKQTGHPYPAQHMGWSLSHWLIPTSILWIDQVPLLKPLCERKIDAAKELLPGGKKNHKARELYKLKRHVFFNSHLEFLSFHQELVLSSIRNNPHLEDEDYAIKLIKKFYSSLLSESNPFDILTKTHEELNHVFISVPYEAIEDMRLAKSSSLFYSDRDDRTKAVIEAFEAERKLALENFLSKKEGAAGFEGLRLEYLKLYGNLIGDSAQNLLLLHLSEKFDIKPQPLSDYDLKIQACAFKHLIEFLDELEFDGIFSVEQIKTRMRTQIWSEIEILNASSFENIDPFLQELVEEVVSYFHARFHESDS